MDSFHEEVMNVSGIKRLCQLSVPWCLAALLALALPAVTLAQESGAAVTSGLEAAKPTADLSSTGGRTLHLQKRFRYRLHLSDVLGLSFPLTPEFDQTVTVEPDGYIALRGIGSISVLGRTLSETSAMIKNAYAKILHDPVITVELKEFEKPYFIVGGEVGHSGKFDLRGDTNVVEALEIAGGFKDSAKHSKVMLFHRTEGGWALAQSVNVKKMLQKGDLEEAAYLQPGDFLYVPKNTLSKMSRFNPTTSMGAYLNPMSVP